MSKLEKFIGKPIKKNINGEEIEVHPLTFRETDVLIKLAETNTDVRTQAIRDLLSKSLKKSFPDATDEEINNFDLRYLGEYLNAVFEASGLEVDKKKFDEMTAGITQTT